jgi:hypothetical protein
MKMIFEIDGFEGQAKGVFARGIVAEPPKGMSAAKCPKVMERIARREEQASA